MLRFLIGAHCAIAFVLGILLFGTGCSTDYRLDPRNFAIDIYYPTAQEQLLATQRARIFWERNASRYGPNPVYLAVQTSKVFPTEIVQNLWPKLIHSETANSFFASGFEHGGYSNLDLTGATLYDTRTGHLVSDQGYVMVDTPHRGQPARFGSYIARYIGTGRELFW